MASLERIAADIGEIEARVRAITIARVDAKDKERRVTGEYFSINSAIEIRERLVWLRRRDFVEAKTKLARHKEVYELHAQGVTYKELARRLGLSAPRVRQLALRWGLALAYYEQFFDTREATKS